MAAAPQSTTSSEPSTFTHPDPTTWDADPDITEDPHLSPSPHSGARDVLGLHGSLEPNPFALWKDEGEYQALAGVIVVLTVVSFMGNVMVIVVTAPKLWAGRAIPPNILILFLAVSDVLRVFFEMLPKLVEYLSMEWTQGRVMCKVVSSLRCAFSDFSMSTMALIGLERYRAVDKPSGTAFTIRSLSLTLLLLCVWTLMCAAPQAFWFDTVALTFGDRSVLCTVPYSNIRSTALYTCITRVTNFLAPLAVSWLCYMGVVHKTVKSRARVSDGLSGVQKSRRQQLSQRVTVTCFCLVILFTLTLTPFQLTLLVLVLGDKASRRRAARCLKYLWLLTLVESAANPFLYGLMWENFRKSVKRILQPCKRGSNIVAPLIPQIQMGQRTFCNLSPKPPQSTRTAQTDPTVGTSSATSTALCKTLRPNQVLKVASEYCQSSVFQSVGLSGMKASATCRNWNLRLDTVTSLAETDSGSLA